MNRSTAPFPYWEADRVLNRVTEEQGTVSEDFGDNTYLVDWDSGESSKVVGTVLSPLEQ
jgi:hypothetical protein